MKVIEIRGNSQVFTMKDGNTFRISPKKTKSVKDDLITNEFLIAEKMGLIILEKEVSTTKKNQEVNK